MFNPNFNYGYDLEQRNSSRRRRNEFAFWICAVLVVVAASVTAALLLRTEDFDIKTINYDDLKAEKPISQEKLAEELNNIRNAIKRSNENAYFWKVILAVGTFGGLALAGVAVYFGIEPPTPPPELKQIQTYIKDITNSNINLNVNGENKKSLLKAVVQ